MSTRDFAPLMLAVLAVIVSIATFVFDGDERTRRWRIALGIIFFFAAVLFGSYGIIVLVVPDTESRTENTVPSPSTTDQHAQVVLEPTATLVQPTVYATKTVEVSKPDARLSRVEWYDNCRGAIYMDLTGFAPNSPIIVHADGYGMNCETGDWYGGSWTETYSTPTNSEGHLTIGYKIGRGDETYTFTDNLGQWYTLSFTLQP